MQVRAGLCPADPLGSLLIVVTAKIILILLTRKEDAMALNPRRPVSLVKSLKIFVYETLTASAVATIVKAAMVPPALASLNLLVFS